MEVRRPDEPDRQRLPRAHRTGRIRRSRRDRRAPVGCGVERHLWAQGRGSPVDQDEPPNNYIIGTRDASGQVAENVIDEEGKVPDWVLDRWKSRMGVSGNQTTRVHLVVVAKQSNSAISGGANNRPTRSFVTGG